MASVTLQMTTTVGSATFQNPDCNSKSSHQYARRKHIFTIYRDIPGAQEFAICTRAKSQMEQTKWRQALRGLPTSKDPPSVTKIVRSTVDILSLSSLHFFQNLSSSHGAASLWIQILAAWESIGGVIGHLRCSPFWSLCLGVRSWKYTKCSVVLASLRRHAS